MMWAVAAIIGMATASSCLSKEDAKVPETDDELLFDRALKELPDQDLLEQQVQQYRQDLYVQTYLSLMLQNKAEAVTEEECRAFFDQYGAELKMEEPIVKGLVVKLPLQKTKDKQLHSWLSQLSQGKDDCMAELEQFCAQRAAVYDNFTGQWVRLAHLTDYLPITVVEPRQFLSIKAYELSDQDYEYHFVVTDYRLDGEQQPYEWARQGIQDLLIEQRRDQFRRELVEQLKEINTIE